MSLAIDVLEPSALLIVCLVLDGALLTRLRGVKPGIGSAANVRFCLSGDSLWLPNLTSLWFHYQIPNFFFIGKGKPS